MLLALLQLGDSALPVGGASHSLGLETLVEEGYLEPANLEGFLFSFLLESGRLDAVFVRRAWRGEDLTLLSQELSARRPARESRDASLKIGRRFCELVRQVCAVDLPPALHYAVAFGAACARLAIPEDAAVQAYLQQSLTGLVSACQRLMPLGQIAAASLLWRLHAAIRDAAKHSERLDCSCFTPLMDLGSLRHPTLETRLFIS